MSKIKITILIFGGISLVISLLFKLEKWSLFTLERSNNLFFITSGVLFFILGMMISQYFFIKKIRKKGETVKSSLSSQELKVLILIAEGNSNKEIADQLFIAETTVKSHVSSVLSKLNARRRTEAVKIGKELKII